MSMTQAINLKCKKVWNRQFFKDGQQAHKKMLSITNHQRMQIKWNIISHLPEWLSSKKQEITIVGEGVMKRESLCNVGGNLNWYSHYEMYYGGLSKN